AVKSRSRQSAERRASTVRNHIAVKSLLTSAPSIGISGGAPLLANASAAGSERLTATANSQKVGKPPSCGGSALISSGNRSAGPGNCAPDGAGWLAGGASLSRLR